MPEQKRHKNQDTYEPANLPLSFFACPNSNCADFNGFEKYWGRLPICEVEEEKGMPNTV